ncbi:MAG: HNH endonuclease [Armatimonadota bacterium]
MAEGISVQSWGLKRRLLTAGLLKEECQECGLGPEWNSKRLYLHLDHINGSHTDNRIENLRLLCPNCHSQTENYAGRKSYEGRQNRARRICCPSCGELKPENGIGRVCAHCSAVRQRKTERPTETVLRQQVETAGYTGTGRIYGVSDNTIRKWLRYSKTQDKT